MSYILWVEKGGFRPHAVWELEQIATAQEFRGLGIAHELIRHSLDWIRGFLAAKGRTLKLVEITTGTGNSARKLYEEALGAQQECVMRDIYRGDEVILIARFT